MQLQPLPRKPRTSTLLRRLFKSADVKDFIEQNEDSFDVPELSAHLCRLCKERGQKREAVIQRASIERTYGYQLFNGTRKPSRDKVLQLAFGFGLTLEETQKLLQIAEKSPLYPRLKRDAAVIYCLERRCGLTEAQTLLYDLELPILGDE